ncbi:MAG: N-acetylmuramoyl-L-alanine amidase [Gordonia sp.]|jgi:N-acetylmuramoyl-L-alanine amidase|uniref:N-acetylmuramoyl-L-alanine amidase n=1 Tax=Gordonia rubripertincta TaxID=36822 RepID=A0ABT4MUY9_GORRU|nr:MULTISPECIES: N-acetylmuramoyl-L-alanine amidase [Mycobacteriales]MBA4021335.1 N-acetylmuramoyl-L-alanine amidase [Gordonia sp. (in: high G+C Gram-positive bacteria)]MCZ4549562.1 N-acetylmuramoyl-L-alanine amidase [Gordonia rubripertincta]OZG27530.1 N-acetylmuramoyl-L-alanine amidase [Williamsia sp. 1138]
MPLFRLGDHGSAVAEIRAILTGQGFLSDAQLPAGRLVDANGWALPEAVFDAETDQAVRAFQQQRGLLVDGVVGPATFGALRESSYRLGARVLCYLTSAPMHGDDVATLQSRLQNLGFYTGLVDGHFDVDTHNALRNYQGDYGLNPDGICGPATLRSLKQLGTRVTGGSPHAIREEEHVRRRGPQLSGKRIVIDPGSGGDHPDADPAESAIEAEILWDLSDRLVGRMTAAGMETFVSRREDENPTDEERAGTANAIGADLLIALRCAHYPNSRASGVASFHYGTTHGSSSTIGRSLSGFIQREIVARTDLRDCRSHERTWEILRRSQMPAVQLDIGYISNLHDATQLSDPAVRDTIAEAILVAVKRLYLLGRDDQPTGTYTFAELLASEQVAR